MKQQGNGVGLAPAPENDVFAAPLSAEQVYHDYAPRVYHTARRMLRSDLDAEDVTQDVLLQVVRHLPAFRGASAFPTWLHRITINAALSYRRKASVREQHRLRGPLDELLENEQRHRTRRPWLREPDALLIDREARLAVERAVAALPETYRHVFLLSESEGLPNNAIAQRLSMSLAAVKSRLHRARQMLRDALATYFGEQFA